MKVTIKKELPKDLFADRQSKAGVTLPVTHVIVAGQTWPVELIEKWESQ